MDETIKDLPSPLLSLKGETGEQEESDYVEEELSLEEEETGSEKSEEYEDSDPPSPPPSEPQQISSESTISTVSNRLSGFNLEDPGVKLIKKVLKRDEPPRVGILPFNREKLKKPVLLHERCENPPNELRYMAYMIGERDLPANVKSYVRIKRLQDFTLFWNDRSEKVKRILKKYS